MSPFRSGARGSPVGVLGAALAASLVSGLGSCDGRGDDSTADPAATLRAERTEHAARERELEDRITELQTRIEQDARVLELQSELTDIEGRRMAREREWLDYTRALAALDPDGLPEEVRFVAEGDDGSGAPTVVEPSAEDVAQARRSREVQRSLRTLLTLEEVLGFDLLDAGLVRDGWTGPVVFRLLDPHGHLSGGLYANRLRLEGSRTARTLTLVLEDGYESRNGVRIAFGSLIPLPPERDDPGPGADGWPEGIPGAPEPDEIDELAEIEEFGGVRRVLLPGVDPMPWVEVLPELFGDTPLASEVDDGLWNLDLVRHSLNRLLREDASAGSWRLDELGGVLGPWMREVQLVRLDERGSPERRVFADRLRVLRPDRGMQLLLEDGVHVRGAGKAPFLDGRFRIFLPRADPRAWSAASLPGLGPHAELAPPATLPEPQPVQASARVDGG